MGDAPVRSPPVRRRRAAREEPVDLDRLATLERRVEDLEDALSLSWLDELADRVDDLALRSVTQDDLLALRLYASRVAAELARVETRLRRELADHVAGRDSGEAATA